MSADASRSGPDRQQGARPRRRPRSGRRPAAAAALAALCLTALATGCGPQVPPWPEPAAAADGAARRAPAARAGAATGDPVEGREATLRGLYVSGPAVRSFTACGTAAAVWLTDRTGGHLDDVYRALAARPYEPVFVEFRGYPAPSPRDGPGAGYEGQVLAVALRHAAGGADTDTGCHDDLGGVAVRAFGREPPWRLDIAESGIALTEADSVRDTVFPYAPPHGPPGRRVYAATAEDPDDPRRIEAVIEERPCTDPVSGTYYSLAAEVRLNGGARALTGCARENWR